MKKCKLLILEKENVMEKGLPRFLDVRHIRHLISELYLEHPISDEKWKRQIWC